MTVPQFRSVCQLTGEKADPAKFFAALSEADAFCAELDSVRELQCRIQELEAERDATSEAFAAAAGFYSCPCGSALEFDDTSTLDDYAALNRWLGQHVPCPAVTS